MQAVLAAQLFGSCAVNLRSAIPTGASGGVEEAEDEIHRRPIRRRMVRRRRAEDWAALHNGIFEDLKI